MKKRKPQSRAALNPARIAVIDALRKQLHHAPDMPAVAVEVAGLDPRDARLAVAIHRTCLQRLTTLEYLLKQCSHRWPRKMQPLLRAAMVSGAAQLLFMQRLPAHAVVHETVELVKRRVRKQTATFANAVLRRVAELAGELHPDEPYRLNVTALPVDGGFMTINRPLLPPLKELDRHLMVATSHPLPLVHRWRERFGQDAAIDLLRHSLLTAPTIVHDAGAGEEHVPLPDDLPATPHERPGFYVWQGDHEQLLAHLAESPARSVQDPASSEPVRATANLQPRLIVDYCAGKGTKTRQAIHLHPTARTIASDPDVTRLAELRQLFSDHDRVCVVEHDQIEQAVREVDERGANLLMLDVPCSNTGVLARRLEARYRFDDASLQSVCELQRQIIRDAAPLLGPGGHVLYSTCSLEPEENRDQARFAAEYLGANLVTENLTLPSAPASSATTYHDAAYHALLAAPA